MVVLNVFPDFHTFSMREWKSIRISKGGFGRWHFVNPVDERSRPDHVAILGNAYDYGTEQSDYALRLLDEPNCRHQSVVYFGDEELDTPKDFFEQQKEQTGLKWDEKKGKWGFGNQANFSFK